MTAYLPTKFAKRLKKLVCLRVTLHQAFHLGSALDVLKLEMNFLSLFRGYVFCLMLLNDRLSTIEGINGLTSSLDGNLSGYASFIENRHHYLRIQDILHRDPVYDSLQCALNCLVAVGCRSFNLKLQEELDGKHLCELLASDKFNHSEGYEVSTEFHHYSIESPCENSPCRHGSTCFPVYETAGFVCNCLPQYAGDFCHIQIPSWVKVNTNEVCFGARNNSYGSFTMNSGGTIKSFKLVHLSGNVTCNGVAYSYWGCSIGKKLRTFLTNDSNEVVFPQNPGETLYQLQGVWTNSTELTFNNVTVPLRVGTGQKFRVWYSEDLKNYSESDNGGKTCIDVYALYV